MLICRLGNFFLVFVSVLILLCFSQNVFAELNGKKIWQSKCSFCHSPNLVNKHKNYSVKDWSMLVDRMKSAGLKITLEEQKAVSSYLYEKVK